MACKYLPSEREREREREREKNKKKKKKKKNTDNLFFFQESIYVPDPVISMSIKPADKASVENFSKGIQRYFFATFAG